MFNVQTEQYQNLKINFGWEGPTRWKGGCLEDGSDFDRIQLIFAGVSTNVEVGIPTDLNFRYIKALPFECTDIQEQGATTIPRKKESLLVTIDQIKNLIIRARLLTKSSPPLPTLDKQCNIVLERKVISVEREVKCEIPNELDTNHIYTLVISSKQETLSASLIKDITRDQEELCKFLDLLLPFINIKVQECLLRCGEFHHLMDLSFDRSVAIKTEIAQIDKELLKNLIIQKRTLNANFQTKTVLERHALTKEFLGSCFKAIGTEGLERIMRHNLKSLCQGNIPPELRSLVDEIVDSFKIFWLNEVR